MAAAEPYPGPLPPFRILAGAEAFARLASADALTPFQQAAFLEPLLRACGQGDAFRLLAIGNEGESLMLPLTVEKRGPFRLAAIAGGKQASYHAPALEGEPAWPAPVLRAALIAAGKALGIDAFTFADCPSSYAGRQNPIAFLAGQPSPSAGWALPLEADAEALLARIGDRDDRKKLRQKARKLAALGPIRAGWAETDTARRQALATLLRWKAERFGAAGIDDPFAEPAKRDFLAMASGGPDPPIRLFTLRAGEQLIAVMAGAQGGGVFSGMVNGHEGDAEIARTSPGEQLIVHLIGMLCAEGVRQLDLGVGEARYKAHYCPQAIELNDHALGITPAGVVAARLFLASRALKRAIKRNPRAMAWLQRIRRMRAGRNIPPQA